MALENYDQARLEEIKCILGEVYEYMGHLKDKKIELLAIGDDKFGGSVQIRVSQLRVPGQIPGWVERAIEKVKKLSWVHIEVSGHDADGDYRNCKFEMKGPVGKTFLKLCHEAPMNETPLHQLLTIEYLKS